MDRVIFELLKQNLLSDGVALATILVGGYKFFKEFPDIVSKYIDLYLKIKSLRK